MGSASPASAFPTSRAVDHHAIDVLDSQRPSLYAPISTLIVGVILETVASVRFFVVTGGQNALSGATFAIGLGTLIGGGISLGTTLWARSKVGQMMEEREQRR